MIHPSQSNFPVASSYYFGNPAAMHEKQRTQAGPRSVPPLSRADRTLEKSQEAGLVDSTGMLIHDHWLWDLPPCNLESIASIHQWLDTPLVGPNLTIRGLLRFIENTSAGDVQSIILGGNGLFRLLLLSGYFPPQPLQGGASSSGLIDTARLRAVASNQEGMELQIFLHIQKDRGPSNSLYQLQQTIARRLPANSFTPRTLYNTKKQRYGFSFQFNPGEGEPIVITVIGKNLNRPQETAFPVKISIKDLILRYSPCGPIVPTSNCKPPWQPFFHLIHEIPLATISHQTSGGDCIRLMDSYTKGCRCVTPEMEARIISSLKDPKKRMEALAKHLADHEGITSSAAYALAFQTSYSLELNDEEAAAIWKAVNIHVSGDTLPQNCLGLIADHVANGSIPFTLVRALVEAMGYIHLSTQPANPNAGQPFSSQLTGMNGSLGMQLTLGDPIGSSRLLLALSPCKALTRLCAEQEPLPAALLTFYESLLPAHPMDPRCPSEDLVHLTDPAHMLSFMGWMIADLVQSPSPFLCNLGLHLACVAQVQGGLSTLLNLCFLPRALTLELSINAHRQLIQSVELCLPSHRDLGQHPLEGFPDTPGVSEESLSAQLVEALLTHPTPDKLLYAQAIWSKRAKSQSSLSCEWAETGKQLFQAWVTEGAIDRAILMLDRFQKGAHFNFATRLSQFVQVCKLCQSLGHSNETTTHVLNLGHIAAAILMPESAGNKLVAPEQTANALHWLLDRLLVESHDDLADTLLRLVCRLDLIQDTEQLRDLFLRTCRLALSRLSQQPVFTAHLWTLGMEKGVLGRGKEKDEIAFRIAARLLNTTDKYAIATGLKVLKRIERENIDPTELVTLDRWWAKHPVQPPTPRLQAKWEEIKGLIDTVTDPGKKGVFLVPTQELIKQLCQPTASKAETSAQLQLALQILGDTTLHTLFTQNHQCLAEIALTYQRQALIFGDRQILRDSADIFGSLLTRSLILSTTKLQKGTHQKLADTLVATIKAIDEPIPAALTSDLINGLDQWLIALEDDASYEAALDLILTLQVPTRQSLNRIYKLALSLLEHTTSEANYIKARDSAKLARELTDPKKNPDPKLEANLFCALALYSFNKGDNEQGITWAKQCNQTVPNIPLPPQFGNDMTACARHCHECGDHESLAITLLDKSCRHQELLPAPLTELLIDLLAAPLSPEHFFVCAKLLAGNAGQLLDSLGNERWGSVAGSTVERLLQQSNPKSLPLALTLLEATTLPRPAIWEEVLRQAAQTKEKALQCRAWGLWKAIDKTGYTGFPKQAPPSCWLSAIQLLEKTKHPDILKVALRVKEFALCASAPDEIETAILRAALTFLQGEPEITPSEVLLALLFDLYSQSPEPYHNGQKLTLLRLGCKSSSPQILHQCCDLLLTTNTRKQRIKVAAALPTLLSGVKQIDDATLHAKALAGAQCLQGTLNGEIAIECANIMVTLDHPDALEEASKWMLTALDNLKKTNGETTPIGKQLVKVCEQLIARSTHSQHFKLTATCLEHQESTKCLTKAQRSLLRRFWVQRQLAAAAAHNWEKPLSIAAVEACFTHIADVKRDIDTFGDSLLQCIDLGLDCVQQHGEIEFFEWMINNVINHLSAETQKSRSANIVEKEKAYNQIYFAICRKLMNAVDNSPIADPQHQEQIFTVTLTMISHFPLIRVHSQRRVAATLACDYWSISPPGPLDSKVRHLLRLDFKQLIKLYPNDLDIIGPAGARAVERITKLIHEPGVDETQRESLRLKAYEVSQLIIRSRFVEPSLIEGLISQYLHAITMDDSKFLENHLANSYTLLSYACKSGVINYETDFAYKTCLYLSLKLPQGHELSKEKAHQIVVEAVNELIKRGEKMPLVRATAILRNHDDILTPEEIISYGETIFSALIAINLVD